jgi:hypothetical protein
MQFTEKLRRSYNFDLLVKLKGCLSMEGVEKAFDERRSDFVK